MRYSRSLKSPLTSILIIGILLVMSVATIFAQQGILVGENKLGEINPNQPVIDYLFSTTSPTAVAVEVLPLTSGFFPQVDVLNASGVSIGTSNSNANSPNVTTTVNLSQPGNYTVRVSGANGSTGQFVLTIQESTPAAPPIPLIINQSQTDSVDVASSVKRYSFNASPVDRLWLEVASGLPTGGSSITLQDAISGEILGTINAQLGGGAFAVPAGARSYELLMQHSGLNTQEPYTITLSVEGQQSSQPPQPTPIAEVPSTPVCTVTPESANRVNVRSGPGTGNAVVATMNFGQTATVIGRASDWWQIDLGGIIGWVADFVITRNGDCSSIPLVNATVNNAPTATPQPTSTPQNGNGNGNNDNDGDGFNNNQDQCPNTPGTANGCPDDDGDSIPNNSDQCPQFSGPGPHGCPDSDGDGKHDGEDACPGISANTPDGCPVVAPLDTDGDGVPDDVDNCPNEPGVPQFNGCPIVILPLDTDGDGVPDGNDNCPTEAGPDFNNGCPLQILPFPDADGDGISDVVDACPNEAGPDFNNGCPLQLIPLPGN